MFKSHWTPVFTGVTTFYETIKLRESRHVVPPTIPIHYSQPTPEAFRRYISALFSRSAHLRKRSTTVYIHNDKLMAPNWSRSVWLLNSCVRTTCVKLRR